MSNLSFRSDLTQSRYSLTGFDQKCNRTDIGKNWEDQVTKAFSDQRIRKNRELY